MDKTTDKLKELLETSIKYGLSELINEQSANSCLVEAIEHIEHLEAENAKLEEQIKALGSPVVYHAIEKQTKFLNKIKADAIREVVESLNQNILINGGELDVCYSSELEAYADFIEKQLPINLVENAND